ncbi:MAG: hypothetical protein GVY29_06510 [Spirochaetes bacterium]|jgi:hypothetical protein|nr:hypothetical protein [Spirochaetota bacterium]
MRFHRLIATLILILCAPATVPPVFAQNTDGSEASPAEQEPVPYGEDEFPEWLVTVRRFEVITIGAFPAALLFTNLGYSLYRFVQASIEAGSVTGENVPVFFGAAGAQDLGQAERRRVLTISVSISGAVALLDLILGFADDDDERD